MKRFGLDEKTVYDGLNNEIFDNWVFQFYSKRYVCLLYTSKTDDK